MRIVDYTWNIVVTGVNNVNTWEEFANWLQKKNVNRHSYITFLGNVYPSTVLGFKLLTFKSIVKVGDIEATVQLTTAAGEMLNDLNDPAIGFEVAISSIVGHANGVYIVRHIIPVADVLSVPRQSVLACF